MLCRKKSHIVIIIIWPVHEYVFVLAEDFGFQHILWVYSGRRGVHCWVCDPDARKRLQQKGRIAVAEYLSVIRVSNTKMHSAVAIFISSVYIAIHFSSQHITMFIHQSYFSNFF